MAENNGSASTSGAPSTPKAVPRGVLARSGLPLPAGARLNSGLRAPRDLTLGGISIPKKTVAPNLTPNISRKSTSTNVEQGSSTRDQRGGLHQRGNRGRGSDRSRGRGRGRGRGTQNLIQLDGIFGSGPVGPGERTHWSNSMGGGGGGGRSAEASVKDTSLPKYIPINQDDNEDTEEIINRVTKAEFVDYGDNAAGEFPLILPLSTVNHIEECKTEDLKVEDDMDVDSHITRKKAEPVKEEENPLKVAQKLLRSLCLGETSTKEDEEGRTLTVFQLPRLPGPSQAYEQRHPNQDDSQSDTQQYKLKNLPKGSFGKLQVLRDGRVRLVSGRVTMELQMAADLPIYQEVVDVHGRMVVPVAKVENKVVCRLNPIDLVKS